MREIALGFKAHSGWAAVVTIARSGGGIEVVERHRIELIDEGELWAKQPYHAAERLEANEARVVVKKGIAAARRMARLRMKEIVRGCAEGGYQIVACAVLMPSSMPKWSVEDILAVHPRMHKAEGILFPEALCLAAQNRKLPVFEVREKHLTEEAGNTLGISTAELNDRIVSIGKRIGPPWSKDQKTAAVAAMIALANINSAISET